MHRVALLRVPLLASALVLLVASSGATSSIGAQDTGVPDLPEHTACIATADDLAGLKLKVKRLERASEDFDATIVEVEVRNTGERCVEPLTFEFVAKGNHPYRASRVLAPFHGRAGRLVAPRSRERYRVLVGASEETLDDASVRVVEASAWDTDAPEADLGVDDGDIRVGRPQVVREQYSVRSSVELENESDWPIDVVLEADYRDGEGGTTQFLVRLDPRETRVETFDHLPRNLGDRLPPTLFGADLARVEVVDWSVVADDGSAYAAALLERAWSRWHRADAERFPLSATVHADVELRGRFASNGGRFDTVKEVDAVVTFEVDGSARVAGADGEPLPSDAAAAIRRSVRHAAAQLTRPSFDEVRHRWRIGFVQSHEDEVNGAAVTVRVEGAEDHFGSSDAMVLLQFDRVRAVSPPRTIPYRSTPSESWRHAETKDERWFVTSTRVDHEMQGARSQTFEWSTRGDDVPRLDAVRYSEEAKLVDAPERVELTFSRWRPGTALVPRPAPPTGTLADELRAAWERHARFPDPEAEVRGRFVATNPGTDGVWIGRTRVEGAFALSGVEPNFWRHSDCTIENEDTTADERAILSGAFMDRLLMWSGRDPMRWAPFDEAFAGATLAPGVGGWIEVRGVRAFARVRLDDGRVVAWRTAFGVTTAIEWIERDGALLPSAIERDGNGRAEFEWARIADGWWFPERIELEAYFGEDWGPETLEFTALEVRPPER